MDAQGLTDIYIYIQTHNYIYTSVDTTAKPTNVLFLSCQLRKPRQAVVHPIR